MWSLNTGYTVYSTFNAQHFCYIFQQRLGKEKDVCLNLFENDSLGSPKLKVFADDNFDLMKTVTVLQEARKRCGKGRNCSLQAISPFTTVYSKDFYCRHVKTRAYLGRG